MCILPFLLCPLAPVELAHGIKKGQGASVGYVNTLQVRVFSLGNPWTDGEKAMDLFLFPWWFFRAACESSWWSIQLVFLLAQSPSAILFQTNDAFEPARIGTSSLGAICAFVFILETCVFVIPDVVNKEAEAAKIA